MKKKYKKNQAGMGLIEIVIGTAIIVIGILALESAYSQYVKFALSNESNVQAAYLSEEGMEAVTYFRDMSWSTYMAPLSTSTTYYLAWDSTDNVWQATTTPQYIDTFLRSFTVSDVMRDNDDKISTTTPNTYDPNTKKITVTVSYVQAHATSTESMSSYITNVYSN